MTDRIWQDLVETGEIGGSDGGEKPEGEAEAAGLKD